MNALLICPDTRPAFVEFARRSPLSLAPVLGKRLIDYWLEHLATRGVKRVLVLASDRPEQIRAATDDGAPWGLRVDVLPEPHELTPDEARAKYRSQYPADWLNPPHDATVIDRLPFDPESPLFTSAGVWFAALDGCLPRAQTPDRIGLRELQPGVWTGLHSRIAPTARLRAPCWLGNDVSIGAGALIGPHAILEDRVLVEQGAQVTNSWIGPSTLVGESTLVESSLALGSLLINWKTGSTLHVPDPFLISSLDGEAITHASPGPFARLTAAVAMLATSPVALAAMLASTLRGHPLLLQRLALLHPPPKSKDVTAYYELNGVPGWLRRWPQLWNIVRGEFAWIGNRPLTPGEAGRLGNDFERLWLATPPGLLSLADVEGCDDGWSEAACAHASYYAAHANRRMDCSILRRAIRQFPARRNDSGNTSRREGPGLSPPAAYTPQPPMERTTYENPT